MEWAVDGATCICTGILVVYDVFHVNMTLQIGGPLKALHHLLLVIFVRGKLHRWESSEFSAPWFVFGLVTLLLSPLRGRHWAQSWNGGHDISPVTLTNLAAACGWWRVPRHGQMGDKNIPT